jgi:ElaB/YqjD/DUF883 family membrane-anchored ribosome-binding protein
LLEREGSNWCNGIAMLGLGSNDSTSRDVTAIQREVGQLMRELEHRFQRLNELSRSGASRATSEASEVLSDTLSDVADRLRRSARAVTGDAAQAGSTAVRKIQEEVSHRPLLALALVAGIGFVLGALSRRN